MKIDPTAILGSLLLILWLAVIGYEVSMLQEDHITEIKHYPTDGRCMP